MLELALGRADALVALYCSEGGLTLLGGAICAGRGLVLIIGVYSYKRGRGYYPTERSIWFSLLILVVIISSF